ncbi:GFA family protein [Shewanella woodyi]|uniref:Glutathione-dependent formaldehyde-activating GFA n=1 Tax=Shewanella woodyi (strain ATCC 51908 / MS32) TaxID=392500 RepID=B1KDJ1_SHEWM|nr:GFA family protein [Shewanella woodyi]ACA84992.1 glutathione-dependent formaldehyde-activating GFA [Shewanella woodyi ATCC 51908]
MTGIVGAARLVLIQVITEKNGIGIMEQDSEVIIEGGCLCRSLRYSITAMPFDADHCHCSLCQKSTGAVVASWMDFRIEQVNWLSSSTPKEYASSETTRRGFCPNCGTSISFRDIGHPQYYTLSIASLDDPNLVAPQYHIHTSNQLRWLNIKDNAPRYTSSRS